MDGAEGGLPPHHERGEAFAGAFWYDAPPADQMGAFPPLQLDLLQPIGGAAAALPLPSLPPLPPQPLLPMGALDGGVGSLMVPIAAVQQEAAQPEAAAPAARGGRRGGSRRASEEERRARNRATQARFRERQKVGWLPLGCMLPAWLAWAAVAAAACRLLSCRCLAWPLTACMPVHTTHFAAACPGTALLSPPAFRLATGSAPPQPQSTG